MLSHHSKSALLILGLVALTPTCGLAAESDASSGQTITLAIEKTENTIQGRYEYVDVYVADGFKAIDGFDLLMAYNSSSLTFLSATRGEKFFGDDYYQWEYFQYRFGANGNCGTGVCPSGKLRVVGIAETNNGAVHPNGYGAIRGDVLFTMNFYVSNDRYLECSFLPIRFCWYDCGDNTLSTHPWDTLLISGKVIDVDGVEITDRASTMGYPTYGGAQDTSCDFSNYRRPTIRDITFKNGGVQIACAESLDARGDINLNEIPYEIADAVLLTNYFLYGPRVFPDDYPYPLYATDINQDGNPLTLADLVYFIRIVYGDSRPLGHLDTLDVEYTFAGNTLAVRDSVGAIYLEFTGKAELTNLSAMDMRYYYDSEVDITRVLVYAFSTDVELYGDVLRSSREIIFIEMATYYGSPVRSHYQIVPSQFRLNQNYPNPFNSGTTITFDLPIRSEYQLAIYNLGGQIVSFYTGSAEAGRRSVSWDAEDYASGVYFYRLKVGEFSESRKMILVK